MRRCAAIAGACGGLGLLGRLTGVRALGSVTADLPPLRPNAAAGLILIATALLLLASPRRTSVHRFAAAALAALVAVGGLVTLGEYAFGGAGLDTLLLHPAARPSPVTAVGLALAGGLTMLAGADDPRWDRWAAALEVALGVLLAAATLGWAFGIGFIRGRAGITGTAIEALLGLTAIWAGLVWLATDRDPGRPLGRGAILLRRLGPVGLTAILAVGVIRFEAVHKGWIGTTAAGALAALATAAIVWGALVRLVGELDAVDGERRDLDARSRSRAEQFRALLELAPEAMVIVDAHGAILRVNHEIETLLGYEPEDLIGRPLELLVPERYRHRHLRHRGEFAEDPRSRPMGADLDLHALCADGREIPVEIALTALEGEDGVHVVAAAIRDVTEKRAAEELRKRLAAIVEHTDDAVFSTNHRGTITSWNGGADRLYGYGVGEATGSPVALLIPADREREESEILARVIAGGEVERYETVHVRKDGSRIDVSLTLSPIRDPNGTVIAASTIARDITERKRFEGQLQYLADHDALTGLFNRRRFEEDVERELARAKRDGNGGAVLAIDLDNFKAINDSLGHSAGDELIKRASELFRARLRTTDVIARLGGDEFAVLLPATDADGARLVAAGLLQAIRAEGRKTLTGRPVTASIGMVIFGGGEDITAPELLAEADIAMYDAKQAGRDRAAVYDGKGAGSERVQIRTTWPQRIQQALDESRLMLMGQPIVHLRGMLEPRREVLVRMVAENGELIPPGVFLHAADRYDLIQELDRWVLRESIRRLAREQRAGRNIHLGVNLSTKTVADPDFPAVLAQELRSAGAGGHGLWLEVKETAAILNVDRARLLARQLGELGCEFAVDDFGAGFASFYYLKHLEFDFVKIDSEFVTGLRESTTNQLVVKSIVDITHGLGKQTIAECIGDHETVELLRSFGVDYGQGFYLGEPQPLDQIDLAHPVMLPPPTRPDRSGSESAPREPF